MYELLKSEYTLLYAEDEPDVRNTYKLLFGYYFNTIDVDNGKEAWEAYLKYKPEVVVLDILMPELNGVEVAKKIREIDSEVIIIIITANDTKEWLYSSVELGLTKFIKKGAVKLSQIEEMLIEAIKKLDAKKEAKKLEEKPKEIETHWYITPKGSDIELAWEFATQKLYKNGAVVDLSKKLTQIINYFSRNRDRIISHEEIAKELWENKKVVEKRRTETDRKPTPTDQKIRAFFYTIKNRVGVELFKSHYGKGYTLELVGEGDNSHKEEDNKNKN